MTTFFWHFSSGYNSSVFTNIFSPHIATDCPNTRHTLVIGVKQYAFGSVSVLRDCDITDHCVYDVMVLRLAKRAIHFNKPQKPIERKLNKNPAIRCGGDTLQRAKTATGFWIDVKIRIVAGKTPTAICILFLQLGFFTYTPQPSYL